MFLSLLLLFPTGTYEKIDDRNIGKNRPCEKIDDRNIVKK
jgi:hypothetical protein